MRFKYTCQRCGREEFVDGSSIPSRKECSTPGCRKYLFSLDWDTVIDAVSDDLDYVGLKDPKVEKSIVIKKGDDTIKLDYVPAEREIIVRLNDKEAAVYRLEHEDGVFNAYRRNMMCLSNTPV